MASIQLLRRRGRFYCRGAGEVLPSAAGAGVVQSDEQILGVLNELTLQMPATRGGAADFLNRIARTQTQAGITLGRLLRIVSLPSAVHAGGSRDYARPMRILDGNQCRVCLQL